MMYIFKKRQKSRASLRNKAQTSFFMIAGLIMLLAALIGFVLYNKIKSTQLQEQTRVSTLGFQAEEIKKLINDCIKKTGFDGLSRLGQTGGYIEVPGLISFRTTSYWYLDQANIQPFLNQTQERLIAYLKANVPGCIDTGNVSQYGFLIEKSEPTINIEFGNKDVTIKIYYPIKLTKDDFSKEFNEFFNTFDIRYRANFEAATEINERLFDEDFDRREPLKKLEYLSNLDLSVSYENNVEDVLVFTITDKKSITPKNEFYTFTFAAKLGNSSLVKVTDLQDSSASNPVIMSYTIFSTDKKAQLHLLEGTTISLNGSDVEQITVQQTYPPNVTTQDVPVYKKNKDVIQRQDIKYIIDNPIYTFEPSGLLFNKYQKLTLYYDVAQDDSEGMGVLMGKKGFWVPIPSKHESEQNRVYSNILGFTEFTALNCASQTVKETIAEHYFEPNALCYISLAVMVIAIIFTFGVLSVAVAGLQGTLAVTFSELASAFVTEIGTVLATETAIGITVGTISTVLLVVSTAATIVGTTTDMFYDHSPDQCETFYPSCDQTITVEESGDADDGKCVPSSGTHEVEAGIPVTVCAQVQSCGLVEKIVCSKCSQICSATFH